MNCQINISFTNTLTDTHTHTHFITDLGCKKGKPAESQSTHAPVHAITGPMPHKKLR